MTITERPDLTPPVTRESVLAALIAAYHERKQIEAETGLRIDDDGHVIRRRTK